MSKNKQSSNLDLNKLEEKLDESLSNETNGSLTNWLEEKRMGNKQSLLRQTIYNKCNGRCAYCGIDIKITQMQMDHIEPRWHTFSEYDAEKHKIKKGSNDISNLNPSCSRCNKWKSTYTLDKFREVVQTSLNRLQRDTPNYRLAKDFGLIIETNIEVKFYFEQQ